MNNDDAAVVARTLAEQMLERLTLVALQPKRIYEAGNSFGLLKKQYPHAEIITSDLFAEDSSIDLLFANLVLPWSKNIEITLREWQRILRPEGVLMFTSLGPDTLTEIQDNQILLPKPVDMHLLGDALMQAGFADPVMDVEHFTVTYRDYNQLLQELKMTKMISEQQQSLKITKNSEGIFELSYEIVYGHAWGIEKKAGYVADETGTVKIPLSDLKRKI